MKYPAIRTLVLFMLLPLVAQLSSPLWAASTSDSISTSSNAMSASNHLETIVLGAGCFWGAEKRYSAITGVVDAISGYAGGSGVKPVYKEIIKRKNRANPNNHAEVVKVVYNKAETSLEDILRNYFEGHDPTQLNRQGNDIGTQYRSIILTSTKEQARVAQQVKKEYQQLLTQKGYGKIATIIGTLEMFYPAEQYHQDYLKKNPLGYCPDHSTGVKFKALEGQEVEAVNNAPLTKGLQIIVIESANFCPYCEKFKKDVVANYTKPTPISFRYASQLEGIKVSTPTWATPTIILLDDGKEVFGHQGYMNPEQFYSAYKKYFED